MNNKKVKSQGSQPGFYTQTGEFYFSALLLPNIWFDLFKAPKYINSLDVLHHS